MRGAGGGGFRRDEGAVLREDLLGTMGGGFRCEESWEEERGWGALNGLMVLRDDVGSSLRLTRP